MAIQAWTLLSNVVIVVLALGYGFWLKKIVARQIESKDASIEAWRTAVESQKIEIERLKQLSAPKIIEEWQKMKLFAEDMAEQKQQAEAALAKLESSDEGATRKHLLAAAIGLMEAVSGIDPLLDEHWTAEKILSGRVNALEAMDGLFRVRQKLVEEARAALAGTLPEWQYIKGAGTASAS